MAKLFKNESSQVKSAIFFSFSFRFLFQNAACFCVVVYVRTVFGCVSVCVCERVCVSCRLPTKLCVLVLVACRFLFFFYIWRHHTMNGRCKGQVHIHGIACVQAVVWWTRLYTEYTILSNTPIPMRTPYRVAHERHLFFAMTVQVNAIL